MIKHNKKRNIGILFETLAYSIMESVTNKDSKIANRQFYLMKRHFINPKTEMNKAYKIYSQLLYNESRNEFLASKMTNYLIKEYSSTINKERLNKEINTFLSGLRKVTKIDEVLNRKIPNYQLYASYNAIKENDKDKKLNSREKILNKFVSR